MQSTQVGSIAQSLNKNKNKSSSSSGYHCPATPTLENYLIPAVLQEKVEFKSWPPFQPPSHTYDPLTMCKYVHPFLKGYPPSRPPALKRRQKGRGHFCGERNFEAWSHSPTPIFPHPC